ncbi:MAG: hypothetical protein QOG41_651 [Thermoleophilaceae bacterium]|nr:hypothetical protein [Thermoleophilaceae bacterium]
MLAYAEVYGWCRGAFAEYPRAAETNPLPKPPNLTFEQSAAVGDSAFTAIAAVRDQGSVRAGQRVLINGASGGVGMFAVQIAKSLGADVTGVCSTRNLDLVRSIGAREKDTARERSSSACEARNEAPNLAAFAWQNVGVLTDSATFARTASAFAVA